MGVIAAHWSPLMRENHVADPSLTHVVARNIVITILWLRSDDDAHLCDDDERLGRIFRRTQTATSAVQKTKITRASCRRRVGTVVPRAENFVDLITADHKTLSEESESRNNHRYAVVVQILATQWLESYPCKTKIFPGDPEAPDEVPGADEETISHLH